MFLVHVWIFSDVNFVFSLKCRPQTPVAQGLGTYFVSELLGGGPFLACHCIWPLQGKGKQPPAGRALRLLSYLKASAEPLECRSLRVLSLSQFC